MTATTLVSRPQGGASLDVASGGAITLADGATLDLGAGVALTISGTAVVLTGLPASDPAAAGALWSNSGVLTISAG